MGDLRKEKHVLGSLTHNVMRILAEISDGKIPLTDGSYFSKPVLTILHPPENHSQSITETPKYSSLPTPLVDFPSQIYGETVLFSLSIRFLYWMKMS